VIRNAYHTQCGAAAASDTNACAHESKKQREIRSDADLDSMADFFESTLAEIRMAAKAGKSRHALRNIAAFASRAYMASDRRITPE
jgi:hypothetical protein